MEIKALSNVIEKIVADLEISPLISLEENYNQIIQIFQDNNLTVYKPEYLNDMVCSKDFSSIFNIYDQDVKNTFFVINQAWDDQKISLILNSFSQPHDKSKVYFVSAYPLPDILRFIQKNDNLAFFELEAMRQLKNISSLQDDFSLIENYYNNTLNLVEKHFGISLSTDIPNSIKNLEKLIINHFRNGEEFETIYDTDIDYFPHSSMVLLGLYLAYVLIKNFEGDIFYNNSEDIKEFGIGFSVNKNDVIDIMSNPINKVFNFYLHGKDSSIINWVYEIKYYLKNPDKIV